MSWIRYNPNPSGKLVGDCTVRAITKATGESWEEAYCGITLQGLLLKDMPSNSGVWGSYLKRKGFRRRAVPDTCPDCYTVEQFCEDHPEGLFVVAVHNHVLCVKDGNYFDAWDSGREIPIFYFESEENE